METRRQYDRRGEKRQSKIEPLVSVGLGDWVDESCSLCVDSILHASGMTGSGDIDCVDKFKSSGRSRDVDQSS